VPVASNGHARSTNDGMSLTGLSLAASNKLILTSNRSTCTLFCKRCERPSPVSIML
jgi:hypothetical protein